MNEPLTPGSYSSSETPVPAGIFGTKIPSSVTFVIAVLLFLLPFAELKCKAPEEKENSLFNFSNMGMTVTNTGLGLALGSEWKMNTASMGGLFNEKSRQNNMKENMEAQEPNNYAIIALVLAALGLGLSFTQTKAWIAVSAAAGALSACALIGLMMDLKSKSKELVDETQKASNNYSMSEGAGFELGFTPWFYVAVIALLAAAFFSFKRMQSLKG
ncbi:MAG TPA: hypothetical protein VIZ28_16425 [Chitinophagaceae bacterium]